VDNQQARQILELYRPGVDDADPQFTEALAQAQRDPELQKWLDGQCALYKAVRARFDEITPPANLRGRILAGQKTIRPGVWWRDPFMLGALAAAAAAVIVVAFLFVARQPAGFDGFRQAMTRSVSSEYKMMLETNDLDQIRDFLAKNQAQANYKLTPALEKADVEGCTILNWYGHKVSLLCFDLGNDNDLWLFVADHKTLPDAPATESPQFARVGQMATASWSEGNTTYLLATKGDAEKLRQYL
jgi:hypothetical protein